VVGRRTRSIPEHLPAGALLEQNRKVAITDRKGDWYMKDREISPSVNRRATGARKYPLDPDEREAEDNTEFDQAAASNKPPKGAYGLTEPLDQTADELSQSDNVDQPSKPAAAEERTDDHTKDRDRPEDDQT
jgi:hypothetical protein